MSMTVETKIKGITELELLIEALKAMGKTAFSVEGNEKMNGKNIIGAFYYQGKKLGISKNARQELMMVGDSDWNVMNNSKFLEEVLQQYGVASIKKKAKELRYTIASEEVMENGSIRIVARAWG